MSAPQLREDAIPPRSPRRFLFLFSDTGGGHRASAQAVKDEFRRLYDSAAVIEMVDVFAELGRWPFNRIPDWYPAMFGLKSIPWTVGYRLSDRMRLVKAMSQLARLYVGRALGDLVRRYSADVIVSFHGAPNYTLLLALRRMQLAVPVVIVTLDLVSVHAGWFAPGADAYLVPTEAARARALRWGVPPECVEVTGMPTRRCFAESMGISPTAARARLGLPQDQPVILMVGGGEGMGPLAEVVRAIVDRRPRARLVAVAGRNRGLYDALRALDASGSLQVEGFVSNMEIWMRAADILVTKAGPNTLSEAFIAGLPVVLYAALPGQEEGNVTHVVENRAGIWAPRPESAADAVMGLLSNPEERTAMAASSRALAYPCAAERIARKIWAMGVGSGE